MARFGNKQVDRFLEKAKQATEDKFSSSLTEDSGSNAQTTGTGSSADAK